MRLVCLPDIAALFGGARATDASPSNLTPQKPLVSLLGEAVRRDGRPEEIPAKALELGAVLGADGGVGVKVETTEVGR